MNINPNTQYTLSSNYLLRDDYANGNKREKFTLHDITKDEVTTLSESLYRILNILEYNKITLNELEEYVTEHNNEIKKGEIIEIFNEKKYLKLLSNKDNPKKYYSLPDYQHDLPLKICNTPSLVEIHPTNACNLNCPHCYMESSPQSGFGNSLPLNKWKEIIDEVEYLKVPNLNISGGEPLVYPYMKEMLNYLTQKRIRTTLISNGMLIDDDIIMSLSHPHMSVSISLDGITAETHDQIRGKGSFDKLIQIINKLKNKVNFNLCFTISKVNKHETEGFLKFCIQNNATVASLIMLSNIGRCKENPFLHNDDKESDLIKTQKLIDKYEPSIRINFISGDPKGENAGSNPESCVSCTGLTSTLFINEKGDVYPCVVASKSTFFKVGSLKENSIAEMWQKPDHNSPFRGGIKYKELTECNDCSFYETCSLKNCRAKAFILEDNIYGKPCML